MWQRYAAIGDSITEGYGDRVRGLPLRSWPALVVEDLHRQNPALRFLNASMAGSTIQDIRRDQLKAAMELRPDLLSLTAGANDLLQPSWTAATFETAFDDLLALFPQATLILLTYPVPHLAEPEYLARLEMVNDIIRRRAGRPDVVLLDVARHPATSDPINLSWDGLHPNALGYQAIARYALEELEARWLGTERKT